MEGTLKEHSISEVTSVITHCIGERVLNFLKKNELS